MGNRSVKTVEDFFALLVDYRKYLILLVVVVSIAMAWNLRHFKIDPTFKSFFAQDSQRYLEYKSYISEFGDDNSILVAIKDPKGVLRPEFLQSLDKISLELEQVEGIRDVVCISNLQVFAKRNGLIGAYSLIAKEKGSYRLPGSDELETNRKIFPSTNLLLSADHTTASLAIRLSEDWRENVTISDIMRSIELTLNKNLTKNIDYRMVGDSVFKQRIVRYSLETGGVFFVVGILVCLMVSLYIFKSGRVALISSLVAALGVFWAVGLMTVLRMELNTGTSLAFGLYMFVTMATVVHIVTNYFEQYQVVEERVEATRQALRIVGEPCLMCSLTTSIGFGSIMVSQVPIMRQLGLIMCLGVILSFVLAISLTPALLIAIKPVQVKTYERMSKDWMSRVAHQMQTYVMLHSKTCIIIVLLLMAAMAVAIPRIQVNTQILNILNDSSKEMKDFRFIEDNLVPLHSVELVINGNNAVFRKPEVWKEVAILRKHLEELPQVSAVDSLPPLLEYLHGIWSRPGTSKEAVFSNPHFIPQILAMMSLSGEGQELIRRYVNRGLNRMHMSVRIKNPRGSPILQTLERINTVAADAMKHIGKTFVTGEVALYAYQSADFARSQVRSLVLAILLISILMMIQLRSWVLGILSLIPNVVPLIVVFGLMGWLNIHLDQATTLVAAVSIGLSVDGTIHYLTHFGRAVRAHGSSIPIEEGVIQAHRRTYRALISTTAILSLGMLLLITSPFQPVAYFGLLTSCAIVTALFGDLVFMPAVMVVVPPIRRAFSHQIQH